MLVNSSSTDEKDACRPEGLRKAANLLRQRRRLPRVTKKVENYVSGVFPNVRGALAFAVESQDAVTATSVALSVPELEAELSTEIDGQLFIMLSAVTDGESFDVRSRETLLWSTRCPRKCAQSCGGHSHEFP